MRRVAELLRTYNIVNSRSGSRYTIRFAAMFLVAGVAVLTGVALLSESPLPEDAAHHASETEDAPEERDPPEGVLPQIEVSETRDGYYIGYPLDQYHRSLDAHYDAAELNDALLSWLTEHPDVVPLSAPEPVHAANDDGVLLGYRVRTR